MPFAEMPTLQDVILINSTLRPSRCRVSLATPVPTLDPLHSLAQMTSILMLHLTPTPDLSPLLFPPPGTNTVKNWHRPF